MSVTVAHAAALSFQAAAPVDGRITVDVVLDPENADINSADISVHFPANLLAFGGYADAESAIPLWIVRPTQEGEGVVHFSGVIPGGLERGYDPEHPQTTTVRLVRLFFTVRAAGSGILSIETPQLLENDGLGTSVSVVATPYPLTTTVPTGPVAADRVAPRPFVISVMDRSVFGKTPRLAVFGALDDESGIDHYEAKMQNGQWSTVTSPYPLPRRLWGYHFTVRAFDFGGNYQEQSIEIAGERPQKLVVLGAFILLAGVFLWYRKRNTLLS